MNNLSFSACLCRLLFCLAVTLGFFQTAGFAQQSALWDLKTGDEVQRRGERLVIPNEFLVYGLNRDAMKQVLDQAPMEFTPAARLNQVVLEIPTPDGTMQRFRIEESQVLSPEIAQQFPDWKYYQGFGIDDPTATARFDVTYFGFRGQISTTEGTYLIDPFQREDLGNYIIYYKDSVPRINQFHCLLEDDSSETAPRAEIGEAQAFSVGTRIRVYRTTMTGTGEYTVALGGQTPAFAQITTTVNRINGIYRRDFAVGLMLVSGTNLVYPNPATDPFNNAVSSSQIALNTTNTNSVIGVNNYDFGHLLTTAADNGLASLNAVCNPSTKASGASSKPNPTGDPFDVDYVAHEMGHQMGGNHTFNATANCNNAPAAARMEPGAGITIMAYAGICSSTSNPAAHSIDNFHVYSQTEAITFSTSGGGAGCGTLTGGTPNTIPIIAPLTSYSIPFNTPFSLSASATDGDGDALTYSWEQFDAGASPSSYPNTLDDDDVSLAARPLFRAYSPTASGTRTFPSLTYILNNSNEPPTTYTGTSATGAVCNPGVTCITGEDLPSIARTMNYRVSVRDNRGGTADAGMTVASVNTTTPFRVTTQNSAVSYAGNTAQTVTWNVANTVNAPINTASVKISLSINGGQSFPIVLATSTTNDGSEVIIVPNTATATARIKVEAVGNIFFDVNDANFTINSAATTAPASVAPSGPIASIVSESFGTGNNQPDPGETLTVTLPLANNGDTNTANLTATLQATGGVASAVTQNYGALPAGGAAVTRSFTFTVSPNLPCGTNVILTFNLTDGVTTFPDVVRSYTTGTTGSTAQSTQNFDGVAAPALPTGWTSVSTLGTGISWRSSTTTPNSAPNAAYANETATANAAALVTATVAITSSGTQISFKNKYNLEDTYDGTVLEYSTNNGITWTDIITGGGSFVSGGYTGTIAAGFGNQIAGRAAWTGSTGGYVDTIVNLPASLNGQSVQFRWLTGSDSSDVAPGITGHWIDDVQVSTSGLVCQVAPTASTVSISGRVTTPQDFGLTNTLVTLTNALGNSQTLRTGKFGSFRFSDVAAGETYILTVSSKRYTFAPRIVTANEDLTDVNFAPQ